MNLRDLKYLVTLVDHGHFGKAADACFVSQPALSMQIKKLEETLGIALIERTNKTFLLTPTGQLIAEQARAILSQVDTMHDIAKLAKDPFSGELRLGVIPTLAPYLLPHIVPGFVKLFPKLTIFLIEQQTATLLQTMKQGKLDAAILALPIAEENIRCEALFDEEFMLAVPTSHALSKRKSIKSSDLEDNILLLLEDGHCLREQALAVCHYARASESKSFQATSLETLRHMVASGVGITLMPKLSCQTNEGITYVPFSTPKPSRTVGLIWRASSPKTPLLEKMAGQMKKLLAKQSLIIK